jgi:hypothetical protein
MYPERRSPQVLDLAVIIHVAVQKIQTTCLQVFRDMKSIR